ncbi:MAG: hypothetical protein RBU30_03990 [Polyangia bacterium]|jgi:hypothetical protein|nr:hypothetical protein [Polyangia bacterium]
MRALLIRSLRWFLLLLALCLAIAGAILQLGFNDEALAKRIVERFNQDRRGRLELESVHWGPEAVWAFVTGGFTHVTVTGVKLYDSRGALALDVPRLELEMRPRELLGRRDLTISRVRVHRGSIALDRYPRPEGYFRGVDPDEIGLLGALEPRSKPHHGPSRVRPSQPGLDKGPSEPRGLTVSNLSLSGVTARLSQGEHVAVISELSARGRLRYPFGGTGQGSLTVGLEARAPFGRLRTRGRELSLGPLSLSARSVPGSSSGSIGVAGALHVEEAQVSVDGRLDGISGRRQADFGLTLRASRFGQVLGRLLALPLREEDSRLMLSLAGTRAVITAKARMSGLGWDTEADAPRLLGASATYHHGQVLVESAALLAWGGRIQLTGWLGRRSGLWGADAQLYSLNAPWFIRRHMEEVDLRISGLAHAVGCLKDSRQSRAFVSLLASRRSAKAPMPQVVTLVGSFTGSRRMLIAERLVAWSDLGILRSSGMVRIPEGLVELESHLKTWQMRAHLEAFGQGSSIDGLDLVGRLWGPATNPAFDGTLSLHDVRYQLFRIPLMSAPATFADGTLVADPLRSPRYGRHLSAALRLTLYRESFHHLERPRLEFTWGIGRR